MEKGEYDLFYSIRREICESEGGWSTAFVGSKRHVEATWHRVLWLRGFLSLNHG